jgi:hypothetical protein
MHNNVRLSSTKLCIFSLDSSTGMCIYKDAMPVEEITLTVCRCLRCGRTWKPRSYPAKRCGWCKSPYWNVPRGSSKPVDPDDAARVREPEKRMPPGPPAASPSLDLSKPAHAPMWKKKRSGAKR